ncbi:MAG: site-2 protease family protein, partial [Armatimonadota bacterium]
DDTAKLAPRISLNPFDHLDPMGTIFLVLMMLGGFPIAWGKPVPINPMRFKSPRWDSLKVSLWGPLSNFTMAIVLAVLLRVAGRYMPLNYLVLFSLCVQINVGLGLFNLIPVPPLDGSHIFSSLLPTELARKYDMTVGRYGVFILMMLILVKVHGISLIGYTILPVAEAIRRVLLG